MMFMISFWVGSTVWSTQCGCDVQWFSGFSDSGSSTPIQQTVLGTKFQIIGKFQIEFARPKKWQRKLLEGDMYVRQMEHTKGHTQTLTAGMWHPFRWGWCWLAVACYCRTCQEWAFPDILLRWYNENLGHVTRRDVHGSDCTDGKCFNLYAS